MRNSDNSAMPKQSYNKSRRAKDKRDRPSFLNYVFSMNKTLVYKNTKEQRYFAADKTDKRTGVLMIVSIVLFIGLNLNNLPFADKFFSLLFDSVCLYLLLFYVLLYVDYRVMKYSAIEKVKLTKREKSSADRRSKLAIVFVVISTIVFIFSFLNSFAFNCLRSLNDENKQIYMNDFGALGNSVFNDFGPLPDEITLNADANDAESINIKLFTERIAGQIKIVFNGKSYDIDESKLRIYSYYIWDSTYLRQRLWQTFEIGGLKPTNTLEIICGDITKTYTIIVEQYARD